MSGDLPDRLPGYVVEAAMHGLSAGDAVASVHDVGAELGLVVWRDGNRSKERILNLTHEQWASVPKRFVILRT